MIVHLLDKNPVLCARYHCDKHVLKTSIIQYAQILSCAHQAHKDSKQKDKEIFKQILDRTILSNPFVRWVGLSPTNYNWLFTVFNELLNEYQVRFEKEHPIKAQMLELLSFNMLNEKVDLETCNFNKTYGHFPITDAMRPFTLYEKYKLIMADNGNRLLYDTTKSNIDRVLTHRAFYIFHLGDYDIVEYTNRGIPPFLSKYFEAKFNNAKEHNITLQSPHILAATLV